MAKKKWNPVGSHKAALKCASEARYVLTYWRDQAKALKRKHSMCFSKEQAVWWFTESAKRAKQAENYLRRTMPKQRKKK